jgi:hypothetical protein
MIRPQSALLIKRMPDEVGCMSAASTPGLPSHCCCTGLRPKAEQQELMATVAKQLAFSYCSPACIGGRGNVLENELPGFAGLCAAS